MNRNAWLAFVALCTFYLMQAGPAFAGSMVNTDNLMGMAKNLLEDLGGADGNLYNLFRTVCIVMGAAVVATGIYGMTQRRKNALVVILVGAVIVSIPNFINIMSSTIFDQAAANSIISEANTDGDSKLGTASRIFINVAVFMVQVVGFCAVYRGLKTIADVAGSGQFQPTQQRTALIFIISGIICINIVSTLSLVASTMGSEGEKYYKMMFGHINTVDLPNVSAK